MWLNLIGDYLQNEDYLTVFDIAEICLALGKSLISQIQNLLKSLKTMLSWEKDFHFVEILQL